MYVKWMKFQRNYSPGYNYWFMGYYQSYFPYHVMELVLFSLSCDTIRVNFLLSSSQFTRTFARAEDEVSKKLFPWVSSRDLH